MLNIDNEVNSMTQCVLFPATILNGGGGGGEED